MPRAIVRISLDGTKAEGGATPVNGKVRKIFQDQGFERIGTGSYEVVDIAMQPLALAIAGALLAVDQSEVALDHFYLYADNPNHTDSERSENRHLMQTAPENS